MPTSLPATKIEEFLRRFIAPDQLTELRILNQVEPDGGTLNYSALYRGDELTEMAREAFRRSGKAEGVYFVPNPINPSFQGQRNRGWVVPARKTAADKDISHRRWVMIDIDPVRPAGTSATASEKSSALIVAENVASSIFASIGYLPTFVDSGNGFHLYIEVEPQPVSNETNFQIQRFLKVLEAAFHDTKAKIDQVIFNPARIMKVPGTIGCKGDHSCDRPWRASRITKVSESAPLPWDRFVSFVDRLAEEFPVTMELPTPSPGRYFPTDRHTSATSEQIRSYLSKVSPAVAGQGGSNQTLYAACQLVHGFSLSPDDAYPYLDEWNATCSPPWSEKDLRRKLAEADKRQSKKPRGYLLGDSAPAIASEFAGISTSGIADFLGLQIHGSDGGDTLPATAAGEVGGSMLPAIYKASQLPPTNGNGKRHRIAVGPTLLIPEIVLEEATDPYRIAREFLRLHWDYSEDLPTIRYWRGQFHLYLQGVYVPRDADEIAMLIGPFAKSLLDNEFAAAQQRAADEPRDSKRSKDKSKKPSPPRVTSTLVADTIKALRSLTMVPSDIDQPAWIGIPGNDTPAPWFNLRECVLCRNAIVHFPSLTDATALAAKTHSRPTSPRMFTSNQVQFDFNDNPEPPMQFIRHLQAQFPDDDESIDLLQEMLGYTLTPDRSLDAVFMLLGEQGAGKSLIVSLFEKLVGTPNTVSSDFKMLCGDFGLSQWPGKLLARFNDASIPSHADQSAVQSLMKRLSSGRDTVAVNRKGMPIIDIVNTAQIVISSNAMITLYDNSSAMSRRVKFLEFTKHWTGIPDTTLEEKFLGELHGIFWWAAEGWRRVHTKKEFTRPVATDHLYNQFEEAVSPISAFVEECCVIGDDESILCSELYTAWQKWCKTNGNEPGSSRKFSLSLKSRFGKLFKSRPKRLRDAENPVTGGSVTIGIQTPSDGYAPTKVARIYEGINLSEDARRGF